jgi:hypothetical protein
MLNAVTIIFEYLTEISCGFPQTHGKMLIWVIKGDNNLDELGLRHTLNYFRGCWNSLK